MRTADTVKLGQFLVGECVLFFSAILKKWTARRPVFLSTEIKQLIVQINTDTANAPWYETCCFLSRDMRHSLP